MHNTSKKPTSGFAVTNPLSERDVNAMPSDA